MSCTATISKSLPKVTIGLPVFNEERFIREALDSLVAQTFADFELIISDNASVDRTASICLEYAERDSRIRFVRQTSNLGAMKNFKFVLDEAVGKYFMWAAADDFWMPCFLANCVKLLDEDETAQMAATGYKCVSRFSRIFNRNFSSVLECIENDDRDERVLSFARLPFLTHKDNLVYSVWRKSFISNIVSSLEAAIPSGYIIGASMNELALLKGRGRYCKEILFHKKYLYIPPGHWADLIKRIVWRVSNIIRKKTPAPHYTGREFISDLERVLSMASISYDLKAKVLAANRQHINLSER